MLNFNPPKYTKDETLKVLQSVSSHLKSKPLLFEADGVFRVSGTQTNSLQIISNILENRRFINTKYSIHDYIGAIKHTLSDCTLMDSRDDAVVKLKELVSSEMELDQKTLAFHDFIKRCAQSKDLNKFRAAEILYNYLHLLMHALPLQKKNQMSSQNLGIVAGPILANLLENDPRLLLPLILKLNPIAESMLTSGVYLNTFEATYPQESDEMRKKELDELQSQRVALLATRTQNAQKIADHELEIIACKEQLRDVKKNFGSSVVLATIKKTITDKRANITSIKIEDRNILKQLKTIEKRINLLKEEKPYQDKSKLLVFSKRRAASFDLSIPESPPALSELVQERTTSSKPSKG